MHHDDVFVHYTHESPNMTIAQHMHFLLITSKHHAHRHTEHMTHTSRTVAGLDLAMLCLKLELADWVLVGLMRRCEILHVSCLVVNLQCNWPAKKKCHNK